MNRQNLKQVTSSLGSARSMPGREHAVHFLELLRESRSSVSSRYQDTGRDLRIDFLRGLAVFVVVADHTAFWRPSSYSFIHLVTVERIGAVSAAEIFVLLAGLVLGMVHRRRMAADGWTATARHLVARAFLLYRAGAIAGLLFWLVGFIRPLASDLYPASSLGDLRSTFSEILLLRRIPPHLNILTLYVALLGCAPAILFLFRRGLTLVALVASWALWLTATGLHTALPQVPDGGPFPILSWQVLFVCGLAVGYHREVLVQQLRGRRATLLVAASVLVALAGLAVTADSSYWPGVAGWGRTRFLSRGAYDAGWRVLFARPSLGLGRLANTAALVILGFVVLTRWWVFFAPLAVRIFVPLGQASLYVYLTHAAILLPLERVAALHEGRFLLATILQLVVLSGVWAMVRYRVLYRWIPR